MKIADIKTHLKGKGQYKAEMILSEKFEGENVFTNDNVSIQPQKMVVIHYHFKGGY
jgi:hypothetical protein